MQNLFDFTLLQGVIASLIANGISTMFPSDKDNISETLTTLKSIKVLIQNDKNVNKILSQSLTDFAKVLKISKQIDPDKVKHFLVSPEVEGMIRQYYSFDKMKKDGSLTREDISKMFVKSFSLFTNTSEDQYRIEITKLFNNLIKCCDRAISISAQHGSLAAHETMSNIRLKMVTDEISALKKTLVSTKEATQDHIARALDYEVMYRNQLGFRCRNVTPPNLGEIKRIPIDEIYITPSFASHENHSKQHCVKIDYRDFLTIAYRVVVLGNPGNGKTTLIQKICYDLCDKYDHRLYLQRQLSPVVVELKKYAIKRQESNVTISQFIEEEATTTVQQSAPTGTFDYLMASGRLVVLFDGLDELIETSKRQVICGDIEAFCNLFPAIPVLVTSRKVGYEQASLDKRVFKTYVIDEFSDDQVESFVFSWFNASDELTAEDKNKKAITFLSESRLISDVRSNPLMLSLMCSIYKGENYIPRNRPEVYKKCSDMLFEQWDKRRDIVVRLPPNVSLKPLIMHLAYLMYSDSKHQNGMTGQLLQRTITTHLLSWHFEDEFQAESAAELLVDFLKGRAWVFTDIGENLYHFTHRTFLEYYTAAYLVRANETSKSLNSVLIPKIKAREWDMVVQLAYQIKADNTEGAIDELLVELLSKKDKVSNIAHLNIVSFAVRSLQYINPKPSTIGQIIHASLNSIIYHSLVLGSKGSTLVEEIIVGILSHYGDINCIIDKYVSDHLTQFILTAEGDSREIAIEIGFSLVTIHNTFLDCNPHQSKRMASITSIIITNTSSEVVKFARANHMIAYFACLARIINIREIVQLHGISSIFNDFRSKVTKIIYPSVCDTIVLNCSQAENISAYIAQLEHVSDLLFCAQNPWIQTQKLSKLQYTILDFDSVANIDGLWRKIGSFGNKPLLGCFMIFAATIDSIKHAHSIISEIKLRPDIPTILKAKVMTVSPEQLKKDLNGYGLAEEEVEVTRRWLADDSAGQANQPG